MGRLPRRQLPDGIVHVTARGNRRQAIVTDVADCERLVGTISDVARRVELDWLAYCIMGNHYHFLVEGLQPNLSRALHRCNGTYAQAFNRRHGLDGHLFEDRFHATAVASEWHFYEALRYILLNPVRAGICTAPEGYRWSSFRATAGLEHASAFLAVDSVLARFGDDPTSARDSFVGFVHGALPRADTAA